jgi:hypothetical protein
MPVAIHDLQGGENSVCCDEVFEQQRIRRRRIGPRLAHCSRNCAGDENTAGDDKGAPR